jgi:hypothetical protein
VLELALEGIDVDTKDVTKVTSNVYTEDDTCVHTRDDERAHTRDNVCVTVKTWGDLRREVIEVM